MLDFFRGVLFGIIVGLRDYGEKKIVTKIILIDIEIMINKKHDLLISKLGVYSTNASDDSCSFISLHPHLCCLASLHTFKS